MTPLQGEDGDYPGQQAAPLGVHTPYAGPGVTGVGWGALGSGASMSLEVPSCMSNSPSVH